MKLLFLNPARSGQGTVPLNIPLLIAAIKKHNHTVVLFNFSDYDIFDVTTRQYESMFFKEAPINDKKTISDREQFYKQRNEEFVGYELKKTDYILDFENVILKFQPDIIAVTSLSVDYEFACKFLKPFKEKYHIPIIFGGIHTILLPEDVTSNGISDYICTGEGENCIPMLLDYLENNKDCSEINGIWYKKGDIIIRNPPINLTNLDTIAPPDFSDFDPIHFYRPFDGKRYKMLNYEFSRGCPFNCSYCVNGVLKEKYRNLGTYHRFKPIEKSIRELKDLIEKYKFDFIRFWDEDFTSINIKTLNEFAKKYIAEINLPFLIYARVTTVTEEKILVLEEMGCKTFAMGIESGNENIRLKILNRKMSNQEIIEKFKMVKAHGIRVSSYNMIGLPFDTRETIFDTIELNRQADPDSFSVTMLEPYRGTPIRKMCEDQGLDPNQEITWNKPQFIPKGMTYDELKGLHRTFPLYVRFPKDRWEEIRRAERDDSTYHALLMEFNNHIKTN